MSAGYQLRDRATAIAEAVVAREFTRHPELAARYGPVGREKSLQDAVYHLAYLADALDADSPALFLDYVAWAKVVLAQRKVRAEDLDFHLACIAEVVMEHLPAAVGTMAAAMVGQARDAMPGMSSTLDTFLDPARPLSPLAHQYLHALLRGERQTASRLVLDAVARGVPVKQVYLEVFQPTQWEIGRLWQINQLSVAQEHYCTAATQLVMSQLYPHIFASERRGRTLVVSCVSGDLHEIGARMVSDFFEMAGWDTFFSGANTPHASVLQTVVERRADVLAVSATIGYHVHQVQQLIDAARAHPQCGQLRILVGGYPFKLDPELWRKVGADGTADDADGAIALAERWVEERAA